MYTALGPVIFRLITEMHAWTRRADLGLINGDGCLNLPGSIFLAEKTGRIKVPYF